MSALSSHTHPMTDSNEASDAKSTGERTAAEPGRAERQAGPGRTAPGDDASTRRPEHDPETLLEGLNPSQREAVLHEGARCWWWPAPGRARPGC